MTLVCLDTISAGVRHDTSHAKGALPALVFNPGNINKTIVDSSEGVHDHTSVRVLSIVDRHEGSADASLVERLVIDGKLVLVLHETTAEGRHVCRDREG